MKSTNHVFAEFLQLTTRINAWLRSRMTAVCGYSADVMSDRLTQRSMEVSILPYTLVAHASLQSSGAFPSGDVTVTCPEALIHVGSGRVTATIKQVCAGLVEFAAHWAYCFSQIVAGAFSGANAPAAVLITDSADEHLFVDGRDDRFVEYCRRGPITPLRNAKRLFIESVTGHVSSEPAVFTYCRHPLVRLVREARLGMGGRARLLLSQVWLLFAFPFHVLRRPELSLLSKEFAYTRISIALNQAGLIDAIVCTLSVWASQPLWMRCLSRAKVHMIWYSQAPQSATYVTDDVKSDAPQVPWIRVDAHWVWTHAFEKLLRRLGQDGTEIHVVGPIVWYLPVTRTPETSVINIMVFDVPALSDATMLMVGEITNNFSPANMMAFLRDILALKPRLEHTFGREVSLRLKMKRRHRPQYDREYFDYTDQLEANGSFLLSGPTENIYSIISASDLVIAYPYTSPAYIAEWLNVPCIYYDPTEKLVPEFFADSESGVRFVQGPEALMTVATELIGKHARVSA